MSITVLPIICTLNDHEALKHPLKCSTEYVHMDINGLYTNY